MHRHTRIKDFWTPTTAPTSKGPSAVPQVVLDHQCDVLCGFWHASDEPGFVELVAELAAVKAELAVEVRGLGWGGWRCIL